MKNFNGKAIYNPSGKAGEYSYWACNFYNGCSNGCTYCYLKKPPLKKTMGGNIPTLKKKFKDESHALEIFEKELKANLPELQEHGLFFTFSSDPMLDDTWILTFNAIDICNKNGVPVILLTKCAGWVNNFINTDYFPWNKKLISIGFTLTGHDELEPNASCNAERIEAIRKLHKAGFKTWASIEPVIDFESSLKMIESTKDFCDLYKIGLESGKKYDKDKVIKFVVKVLNNFAFIPNKNEYVARVMLGISPEKAYSFSGKIYFKDSLLKAAGIDRANLPENCVTRDYNIFNI